MSTFAERVRAELDKIKALVADTRWDLGYDFGPEDLARGISSRMDEALQALQATQELTQLAIEDIPRVDERLKRLTESDDEE